MVKRRGKRWYFDFMVRRVRYRGAIPEARTKWQAEKAETKIRLEAYEKRYGGSSGDQLLSEFVRRPICPGHERTSDRVAMTNSTQKSSATFFAGRTFNQISPLLIEKFKKQRRESVTRYKRQRARPP
jgi:hypothetical protein